MPAVYRIIDEPAPTALERTIVNPTWPLFASMFAGSWLAFPWFVLNAFALGGRRRFAAWTASAGLSRCSRAIRRGRRAAGGGGSHLVRGDQHRHALRLQLAHHESPWVGSPGERVKYMASDPRQ